MKLNKTKKKTGRQVKDSILEIHRGQRKEVIREGERKLLGVEGNINDVWNIIATCIKNTAKEIVVENRSSMPKNKEI